MENLKEAVGIIKKIEDLGYTAVIVGGAVRDKLLGLSSFDIDIATSMPIELIKNSFKTIDNGSSYLSVTIDMNGNLYEITTFREDIAYSDHRHPEVSYTDSFYKDSFRRDFTINALAYDSSLNIIDYHNGIKDLNNKIIRTIGNPSIRFNEDALRILRGLYLASKLNFVIEETTLRAMIENKKLLATLSDERLLPMLHRIINAKYDRGIAYIKKYNLFEYVPVYKNMLEVAYRGLSTTELSYAYFIKFNELAFNYSNEKRICSGLRSLINNGFNVMSLYKYKDAYLECRHTLEIMGYNVIEYDNRINSFVIKNDNELAVKREEIASYFNGKEKAIMIDRVIESILNKKIPNIREEILRFIGRGL